MVSLSILRTGRASECITALMLAGLFSLAQAAEIASDPGDYIPLPAGTNLLVLYMQHNQYNAYYANGSKLPDDFAMESNIGILRYVHFTELGGVLLDPQIVVPFGEITLDKPFAGLSETSASGMGDPLVGTSAWLYNNAQAGRYLVMTAAAALPLGDYEGDRGPINLGQNRWRGIFQMAYVTPITAKSTFELVTEYAVYGKNDDYFGMTQQRDDTYGLQGHLSYTPVQGSRFALSYFHDFGGETELGGISQSDEMDNSRWLLSAATNLTADTQLLLQYGESIKVENGPYEHQRVNLRLVKAF